MSFAVPMIVLLTIFSVITIGSIVLVAAQTSTPSDVLSLVASPDSRPQNLTYGDWGAKWWQWIFSIPSSQNPLSDTTGERCTLNQNGTVWFLVGTFGGSATRQCTIPAGTSLFFPLLNGECSIAGGDGTNEQELRSCAKAQMDKVTSLKAIVDGVQIPDLQKYRAQSQLYTLPLPNDNIMGLEPGSTPSIAEGYWIFLKPLSPGNHEITFGGSAGNPSVTSSMNFVTEVTYHLTISNSTATTPTNQTSTVENNTTNVTNATTTATTTPTGAQ
jgi:hypothetical protein